MPFRVIWKRHHIPFGLAPRIRLSKVVRIVAPLDRPKEKTVREVAPSDSSVDWKDRKQGSKMSSFDTFRPYCQINRKRQQGFHPAAISLPNGNYDQVDHNSCGSLYAPAKSIQHTKRPARIVPCEALFVCLCRFLFGVWLCSFCFLLRLDLGAIVFLHIRTLLSDSLQLFRRDNLFRNCFLRQFHLADML